MFVKISFGPWSEWLYCSENCGVGETTRSRTCSKNASELCPAAGSCVNVETCLFETKPCQIQKCLTCANFANYCDKNINTECIDAVLDNGEVMVSLKYHFAGFEKRNRLSNFKAQCHCKSPFELDESGDCTKCNTLASLRWQCDTVSGDAVSHYSLTLIVTIFTYHFILN